MWFKVKRELLVKALTKRKAMTANDTLILPYSLSEVGNSLHHHSQGRRGESLIS